MFEELLSKLLEFLLDSFWIALIFWAFLWICLKVISGKYARLRYYISLFVFFGFFPVLSVVSFGYDSMYQSWLKPKLKMIIAGYKTHNPPIGFDILDRIQLFLVVNNHYICLFWLVGVFIYMIKLFYQSKAIGGIREVGILDYGLDILKNDFVKQLGIKKEVAIKFINNGSHSFTTGYFKPVIYFPIQVLTGFSSEELELVLFHELIHIKRKDYLINFIQLVLEACFFFNPFVKFMSTMVKNEREASCDYNVINQGYSKLAYAKALERSYELHYNLALSFGNENVFSRIKNLTWFQCPDQPSQKYQNLFSFFLALGFILLTLSFGVFTKNSLSSANTISNDIEVYPRIEFRYDTVVFKRNPTEALYMLDDELIGYAEGGVFNNEKLRNFQRKEIDNIDHMSILIIDKVLGDTLQKGKQWKDDSEWKLFKQELEDRCLLPEELYTTFISPFNVFYINDNPIPEDLQNKYISLIKSNNPYSSENLVFIHQMITELQKDKLVDENFDKVEVVFTPMEGGKLSLNGEMLTKKYADKYFIYLKEIFKTPLYENRKYFIK